MLHKQSQDNNPEKTDNISSYIDLPPTAITKDDKSKISNLKTIMIIFLILDIIVMVFCFLKSESNTIIQTGSAVVSVFGLFYGLYRLCTAKLKNKNIYLKKFELIFTNALMAIIFLANVVFYAGLLWWIFKMIFITPDENPIIIGLGLNVFIYFDIYSFPFVFAFFDSKLTKLTMKLKLCGIILTVFALLLYFPPLLFMIVPTFVKITP